MCPDHGLVQSQAHRVCPATFWGDDILLFLPNAVEKVIKSSSLGGYAR